MVFPAEDNATEGARQTMLTVQPSVRRTLPDVRFCRFSGDLISRAGMVCWGKYYWRESIIRAPRARC